MSRKVHWVPEAAVRAIHAELIAEHGGKDGLRDPGLLSSALARPRNTRVYGKDATVFDLAAAYAGGITLIGRAMEDVHVALVLPEGTIGRPARFVVAAVLPAQ